jgi:hypothetical protein
MKATAQPSGVSMTGFTSGAHDRAGSDGAVMGANRLCSEVVGFGLDNRRVSACFSFATPSRVAPARSLFATREEDPR